MIEYWLLIEYWFHYLIRNPILFREYSIASKTSYEKEWGTPSASQLAKAMYSKGKEISELFPQRIDIDDNSDAIEFSHHEFNGWDCAIKDILVSKIRNCRRFEGQGSA